MRSLVSSQGAGVGEGAITLRTNMSLYPEVHTVHVQKEVALTSKRFVANYTGVPGFRVNSSEMRSVHVPLEVAPACKAVVTKQTGVSGTWVDILITDVRVSWIIVLITDDKSS